MSRYIIRRLLLFGPVLIGVSIIVFCLMRVVPGDVARLIVEGPEGEGQASPEAIQQVRAELGLDRPLVAQYLDWLWHMIRLDGGESLQNNRPVFRTIWDRLPFTFELAALAMVISVAIAIPLGVLMAVRQDTWLDYLLRVISIAGLAMPNFWVAILMILIMVIWFHWFPPLGYSQFLEDPLRNFKQVLWPALAIGYSFAAIVSRMTRSTMLEVMRQDYVRTGMAKGLGMRLLITRHILRNSLLPVITIIGLQFATLLGGTVIMERLWNLPGLGESLIRAIEFRDFPMVQAIVVVFAFFILALNLLVDLLYGLVDPRIRYG